SIGIVHRVSLSRIRKHAATEPTRPIALIELKRNRAGASDSAGRSDAWRTAAAALGRKIETYEATTLGEIPARSYSAWILVDQPALDDGDFAALDAYLQLGGGVVLAGRAGEKGSAGRAALE